MTSSKPVYDHRHASFTKSFLAQKKRDGYRLVGCEVMFNHYGDRGVVDVVLCKQSPGHRQAEWLVCEMKPQLFDIGDTIRQVKRAQEYFCKARPDMARKDCVNRYRFLLVLEANEHNYMQAQKYGELFQEIEIVYHHQDEIQQRRIMNRIEIEEAVSNLRREIPCA